MSNLYKELKNKHQQEVNNFPMMFAFSKSQFTEGMQKLGLSENDTDKIYSIGGGGYIKRTDSAAMHGMFDRHEKEMKDTMLNENFVYDMFDYELGNHEYTYTYDITDTINALGLTMKEIDNNSILLNGLNKACKAQKEWDEKYN